MIIRCLMCLEVAYRDKEGKVKKITTRPGAHNYPQLNHKDPLVADQLRVFRKHKKIEFDELLESDMPEPAVKKSAPKGKNARGNKKTAKPSSESVEKRDPDKSRREISN